MEPISSELVILNRPVSSGAVVKRSAGRNAVSKYTACAARWEPHKKRIYDLYISQDRSLKEVMEVMKTEGLSASKAQYQRQFKKWNFHKHITENDWKIIGKKLEEIGEGEHTTFLYVYGRLVPNQNICKQTGRAFTSTIEGVNESLLPVSCRDLPQGVSIEVLPSKPDSYLAAIRACELPWTSFGRLAEFQARRGGFTHIPDNLRLSMFPLLAMERYNDVAEQTQMIHHKLSAILPLVEDDEILRLLKALVGYPSRDATWEFLKLMVYMLSNNLFPWTIERAVSDEILKWFRLGSNIRFLKCILSSLTPTIRAFAEPILRSAVLSGDTRITNTILKAGISPNISVIDPELISYPNETEPQTKLFYCSLLGSAVGRKNKEISHLLLQAGAITGRPVRQAIWDLGFTPLQVAILCENFEMLEHFLDKGYNTNIKGEKFQDNDLAFAILAKSRIAAQLLLDHGADLDYPHSYGGITPLEAAAKVGDIGMVTCLLERGANVNRINDVPSGYYTNPTALQCAAENGNINVVRLLIEKGADVNETVNKYAYTALVTSIIYSHDEVFEFLLSKGADVNDARGKLTALEAAIDCDKTRMARILLAANADPTKDSSIIYAVKTGNLELVSLLADAGADVNKTNRRISSVGHPDPLTTAVQRNDSDMVRHLLSLEAYPKQSVALEIATFLGHRTSIPMLLTAGADVNIQTNLLNSVYKMKWNLSALQIAAWNNDMELILRFIEVGGNIHCAAYPCYGRTALQAAVENHSIDALRYLLKAGADVNAPPASDLGGVTALQAAIKENHLTIVDLLLEAGANANDSCSGRFGYTSLQLAAKKGNNDLIYKLLAAGADVNHLPAISYGYTALQVAADCGHYETVKLLIAKGADVNADACERGGNTALQVAARAGYIRIAKLLFNAGANVNAFDSRYGSKTALEFAAENGKIDMIKLLLIYGAKISGECRSQFERAIQLATEKGHHAAAEFLRYHQLYQNPDGTVNFSDIPAHSMDMNWKERK